jgi:hypothetical protein
MRKESLFQRSPGGSSGDSSFDPGVAIRESAFAIRGFIDAV